MPTGYNQLRSAGSPQPRGDAVRVDIRCRRGETSTGAQALDPSCSGRGSRGRAAILEGLATRGDGRCAHHGRGGPRQRTGGRRPRAADPHRWAAALARRRGRLAHRRHGRGAGPDHAVSGSLRLDIIWIRSAWPESWFASGRPRAARRPGLWREALALAATSPSPSPPSERFLHRDYHPANTIWSGRRLAGVVDWVSASTGPAAVDLAHWRTNLGTRHGIAVADRVIEAYAAVAGAPPADQTWWDVRLALDYLDAPDSLGEEELERFEAYLGALLVRA
ncbi:MAG: phosphotransferase [Chloroflexota bacterium]